MRIQELHLAAFGPFTDRTLVFDQEAGGLHIVYGPNEAGKSSALRGLKALLYGIEERTPDDFFHAKDKLRIRGRVRAENGQEIEFVRRKGRKNTLSTPEGGVLDAQVLVPFLHGVTPDLFETLFGIDHQALVQGGQEILEQKGEVGQALFSAALGSHALHAVLARLDDEADGLFRPRGSTQTINSALKAYSELKKEIRQHSLSSREWDEHRRTLERTTKELAQIQSELAADRGELNRLKRIRRILPKLAKRRERLRELESLDGVVILPGDFAKRRQQAVKTLETAQAIFEKAGARLDGFQAQLEKLSINQGLLERGAEIEELLERLGAHRKALQDRPHLDAERQQLLADAASLLKAVRPDFEFESVEKLRPLLARHQKISELGGQYAVLISRLELAESSRRETEAQLKRLRKESSELPEGPPSEPLRRAIVAARKLGDIDLSLQSAGSELASLQRQCTSDFARLPLCEGRLEALPEIPVPDRANVQRFEQAYDELEKRIQRLREKQDEATDVLQEASLGLDEIQRVGKVPTEADLIEVRADRSEIWRLLRRRWIDGEEISAEISRIAAEAELPDAFEQRVIDADELSDRLRREADRVHARASLLAKQKAAQEQTATLGEQLETCNAQKHRLDVEWHVLWAPCRIEPRTPREMRAWLEELEKLRERVVQLNVLRQKSGELEQTRSAHIQRLARQSRELGWECSQSEALDAILLECEEFAHQLDESRRQRELLSERIKDLEGDLESSIESRRLATQALEAWKAQWRTLLERFGLQDDASPSEAADFIEKVRDLFAKQDEAAKLQIRIQAIDGESQAFHREVAAIVASIAPELADLPVDDAVMRLNSLLSTHHARQTRRHQIEEQLEQTQQEIQDADTTIQTMTDRLHALCSEAGRDSPAELEEAERQSIRYLGVKAEIDAIEHDILDAGDGATIGELDAEARSIDADELPGRTEALSKRIDEELEPKRTALAEAKGGEEKELELMDGSDRAAALADRAQAMLAGIRSDAERYVRVKLAGRVLREQIEHYRKENQGPLLKRAGEHFATLTLGSFQELLTDFNDKDEPILAGVRLDGERVSVEGMSSGTRDQLYLALRLASLEKYMEKAEPMPFIVDDVLVDFDDERSESALKTLAALAEKTQVILFSHHSQVVEQAKRLPESAKVAVHQLS
jgi:uncharacterized protein YhaN